MIHRISACVIFSIFLATGYVSFVALFREIPRAEAAQGESYQEVVVREFLFHVPVEVDGGCVEGNYPSTLSDDGSIWRRCWWDAGGAMGVRVFDIEESIAQEPKTFFLNRVAPALLRSYATRDDINLATFNRLFSLEHFVWSNVVSVSGIGLLPVYGVDLWIEERAGGMTMRGTSVRTAAVLLTSRHGHRKILVLVYSLIKDWPIFERVLESIAHLVPA